VVDDAQLVAVLRAALRTLPGFPEKDIKVEAAAGTISITGVVPGADDVRRGMIAASRGARSLTYLTDMSRLLRAA